MEKIMQGDPRQAKLASRQDRSNRLLRKWLCIGALTTGLIGCSASEPIILINSAQSSQAACERAEAKRYTLEWQFSHSKKYLALSKDTFLSLVYVRDGQILLAVERKIEKNNIRLLQAFYVPIAGSFKIDGLPDGPMAFSVCAVNGDKSVVLSSSKKTHMTYEI